MARATLSAFVGFVTAAGLWNCVEAAPITFNTALPVAQGELTLRELGLYRRATDDPSTADRELTVTGSGTVLGYGVTGDLALFGLLPYLDKELELDTPSGRVTRGTSGVGDLTVFARYTAVRRDRRARTFRIAPFAGIEAPTGDDDERDALGRVPQPLQPGSGSWDAVGGVVATYFTPRFQLDGQIAYQANQEANDFELGDTVHIDAALQYRLLPRELGGGLPDFLYGVMEINLVWRDENRIDGRADRDSGGTQVFVTPGLQYVSRRWVAEAAAQVPIVQDLNGDALEDDVIVRAGVRFNFGL
ncbi:MAG: transporter [Gammaproteobacteria bacterium]|nr:transporter [Gammaproteobacteria bacterium]NIR85784.1 transporter [Gammaproteobacteria bacterium]NIU06919.1 transporter [Gammaproteobacteria bacterium]NIV53849.1 transporter [Gammaproteobacteria bacterium]NIX88192.1 transporter [Gammaproteobacteria bacterium]